MTTTDLFINTWGEGTPVVLVHGALATGAEEWEAQLPLAGEGFRLVVPDRRGYGQSPAAMGEDFMADAEDITTLMGDGAHLVGHSYGGLGCLLAAARRPEATRSLALLEPPTVQLGQHDPAAQDLTAEIFRIRDDDASDDRDWVMSLLGAVGTDPDTLPPAMLDAMTPLAPIVRRGRWPGESQLPLAEVESAMFPKLVVSGGHSAGFDAICDDLADQIAASRAEVEGAGHEIQFTGPPINDALLGLWGAA